MRRSWRPPSQELAWAHQPGARPVEDRGDEITVTSKRRRIDSFGLELNPQTVQLAPLINEVIDTAGQLAEQNKNRLVVEAQENLGARSAAVFGRTARSPSGIRLWQCPNRV